MHTLHCLSLSAIHDVHTAHEGAIPLQGSDFNFSTGTKNSLNYNSECKGQLLQNI